MNKKILGVFVSLLAVAILATPLVAALSWEEKNNDKFQSFAVTAVLVGTANEDWKFSPSEDAPNKVVMSADEIMENYEIIIDGTRTYIQDTHFEYTGRLTWTFYDPEEIAFPIFLTPCRMMKLVVKYSYTFLPASGIEGTINMLAIAKGETIGDIVAPDAMLITSKQGTGDLQNVNIKATTGGGGVVHKGTVIGWPDVPIPTP